MTMTAIGLLMGTDALGKTVECPAPGKIKVGVFCNKKAKATIDGEEWVVTDATKGNLPGSWQKATQNIAKLAEGDPGAPGLPDNACSYKYKSSSLKTYQVHIKPSRTDITVKTTGKVAEITNPESCPLPSKGNTAKVATGTPAEKAKMILDRLAASASSNDGDALETAKQNAIIFAQTCFIGKSPAALLKVGSISAKFKPCLEAQEATTSTILESIDDFLTESMGKEPDDDLTDNVTEYLLMQSMNDYIMSTLTADQSVKKGDVNRLKMRNDQTVQLAFNGAKQDLTAKLK